MKSLSLGVMTKTTVNAKNADKNYPDDYENCSWSIDDCNPGQCAKDKLQVTTAQMPSWIYDNTMYTTSQCYGFQIPEIMSPDFKPCCDPPSRYNEECPVEPSYLWSHYYDEADDDEYCHDNQTVLDAVFDHSEETVLVYCNHPADSKECRQIFYKEAADTIIRLPDHVEEGPWARVISIKPVKQLVERDLPDWNGIYSLTFDYNFHLINGEDEQVDTPVDYTNLLPYWDEVTDSPASKRKRSTDDGLTFADWKDRVDRAKALDTGRSSQNHTGRLIVRSQDSSVHRRWWGAFVNWVKKLTTIIKSDGGVLPMGLVQSLVLYSRCLKCSNKAVTFTTGMDITADFNIEMNARYSYYFSGTVVPPAVTDMYAYMGIQPRVYAGIWITGNADLYYPSERKKIIDTLTYPGLAIKGIAAVGPTMDLWGQITGQVTVSGDLRVQMTYKFKPVKLYFPNNDEVSNNLDIKDMEDTQVNNQGLEPSISGNVCADGLALSKGILADAHVSVFANTTRNFHAQASAAINNGDNSWSYGYLQSLDHGLLLSKKPLPGAIFGRPASGGTNSAMFSLDFDSYHSSSNTSLAKRENSDVLKKEPQFTLGSFKSTTRRGSTCDAFVPSENMLRRDLISVADKPKSLQKQAPPTDCTNRLPRLYYNCETFFSDFMFQGPAGAAHIPGICSNVEKFLNNNKCGNKGYTLTWESGNQGRRRSRACPDNICCTDNANYEMASIGTATGKALSNCDKFPFASTKAPTGTVRACVPTWQNDVQGNCHSKRCANGGADLLNNLETNVECFNTYGSSTLENPSWARWAPNRNTWVSKNGLGGRQRLSSYPSDVPKAFVPGLSQADRDSPENLSYYHKRNFTLFLSYPRDGQQPDSQWPDQPFTDGTFTGNGNPRPATTTVGPSTWVICAVSTMGQERYRFESRANGLCTDAQTTMPVWGGLASVVKFYQCKIGFSGSPRPTKRDSILLGYLSGEPCYCR
ncbi:hypothetical protein BDV09DRAFT_185002 [Aspergillus tetrazonus]